MASDGLPQANGPLSKSVIVDTTRTEIALSKFETGNTTQAENVLEDTCRYCMYVQSFAPRISGSGTPEIALVGRRRSLISRNARC